MEGLVQGAKEVARSAVALRNLDGMAGFNQYPSFAAEVFMVRNATILALLFGAASVCAQDAGKKKSEPKKDPLPGPAMMVDQILERLDRNKDGKISKEEAANVPRIKDSFERIDQNKDGHLDPSELRAMARLLSPPGGPGMRPGPGGFGPGFRPDPLDFDALDKNADGRLTKEELRGSRFADSFDSIDANKDGKLDPKEWNAFHKKK